MKKIKSFKLMYLSLAAVVVSVAAVGFSNWIVINTQEQNTNTIKAEIGAIEYGDLTAVINQQPEAVRFDAIEGDGTGSITTGTDTNHEKLDFSIVFTIDRGTIASFNSIAINLKFNTGENEGAKNFIDKLGGTPETPEYIDCTLLKRNVSITLSDTAVSEVTTVEGCTYAENLPYLTYKTSISETSLTCTLKYTFRWGSVFGNVNPCVATAENTVNNLVAFGEAFNAYNGLVGTAKDVVLTITPSIVENA